MLKGVEAGGQTRRNAEGKDTKADWIASQSNNWQRGKLGHSPDCFWPP